MATMARADALRAQRCFVDALALYDRVLAAAPDRDDAFHARALTLADLGSSQLAYEALRQRPALFADYERERIEDDRVAHLIAWGRGYPVDDAEPLDEAGRAYAALQALQRDAPRKTRWEATRLRTDALIALNQLQRHRDVVDGYEAMRRDGIDVPAYALPTVGDSLLALRRPEAAAPVLEQALANRPDDVDTSTLLGYAWLEQERFDRAMPIFERLAREQPAWPRRAGARSGYENWDRYTADANLAMARAFGNDNARAEDALMRLGAIAPANADLQATIGDVEARRLRPSAALARYDIATTLDPRQRDARIGRIGASLALDRVDDARAAYASVRERTPDDPRLAQPARELASRRGWQVRVDAQRGRSSPRGGGTSASPFGSRDGGVGVAVESPLIDDRWRIGAVADDQWADFDGQRVRFRRAGIGASYRYDRLGVSAYATRALDDYDDGGVSLTLDADWRFSDAWTGGLRYARKDLDASLQARRFGITADSIAASATWTPSETTRVAAQAARYRYDDGNRRDLLGVDASQRLLTRPHWLVDGMASLATSRGSRGDATPYFNPSRDASATIGLGVDHIAWRRYEREFRQRLEIGAGPYWQEGYGTRWVPTVAYRHRWQLQTGHVLEYGVGWSRPVYDGDREQRVVLDLAYRWGDAP